MNCKLLFDYFFSPLQFRINLFHHSIIILKNQLFRMSKGECWCLVPGAGPARNNFSIFLNVAKMRMNYFEIISQASGFHPSVNTSVLIWLTNLWTEFKKRKSVHKFKGDKFKKIVPPRIQVENSFISSNHIENKRQ